MKKERFFYLISISALLFILFFQRECSNGPDCPEPVSIVTEHFDTTHHFTNVPVAYPVVEILPVEWPVVTDSFGIFMAYYKKYVFNRILRDDTLAFIRLIDTVSQNMFLGSSLEYVNRKPTQVIIQNTTIVSERTNKVFVGPMFGSSIAGDVNLGASAVLVTKRDNSYMLNVDILQREIEASVLWKISFRKNKKP